MNHTITITNPIADLGWSNDWKRTPKQVRNCETKEHEITVKKVSKDDSHFTYSCDFCQYIYHVDRREE
jgi:predicted SprT family Zn-dependent metalloprotease